MSFSINGPDNNLPAIQKSHQTNDGGAGNLGYFKREKKKKKDDDENDTFEFSSGKTDDDDDPLMDELDSIGTKIRNFWQMLHKKNEEPDEEKNSEDK